MKKLTMVFSLVLAEILTLPLQAQNLDDVRLFQSYFFDAPIAKSIYGEGNLSFSTYDYFNNFNFGVQGGYPLNEKIELGTGLRFINWIPEKGNGQSGISDLGVYGRYHLLTQDQISLSAGGLITLPVGSEDVGQGNLNFGAFAAGRYSLNEQMVLVGTIGLIFFEKTEYEFNSNTFQLEEKTSYDSYLNIGMGGIFQLDSKINLVGELTFQSEGDYIMLTGGGEFVLDFGTIRGALGIGLDDGAPNFMLMGGLAISISK